MKRLLFLLLFMNVAAGISVSISADKYEVGSLGNVLINYTISLNKEELTNYSILVGNMTIVNQSFLFQDICNFTVFNASSLSAGSYPLILLVKSPSVNLREEAPFNLTILKNMNFEINVPHFIYAINDVTSSEMFIKNTGNTPLSLSIYFEGALSDVSINPQSFVLRRGEERHVTLMVSKPSQDYNTTLVVNVNNGELIKHYNINVIKPQINLSLGEIFVRNSHNKTEVATTIINHGNSLVNLSVGLRTFSLLHGFKTINNTLSINPGESYNYSVTFPRSTVLRFSLNYFNGTENVVVEKKLSMLDIGSNISLSSDKMVLLIILFLLLGIIIYRKFHKRRP